MMNSVGPTDLHDLFGTSNGPDGLATLTPDLVLLVTNCDVYGSPGLNPSVCSFSFILRVCVNCFETKELQFGL